MFFNNLTVTLNKDCVSFLILWAKASSKLRCALCIFNIRVLQYTNNTGLKRTLKWNTELQIIGLHGPFCLNSTVLLTCESVQVVIRDLKKKTITMHGKPRLCRETQKRTSRKLQLCKPVKTGVTMTRGSN